MKIEDVYDQDVVSVLETDTLAKAAQVCIDSKCSDLMIVDASGNFIGVLSEGDLIRRCMPNYNELLEQGLSMDEAFALFIEKGKKFSEETVMSIAITNPISVAPGANLHKAAATMVSKNIRRLPVVEKGKLLGTISRAIIVKSIFSQGVEPS